MDIDVSEILWQRAELRRALAQLPYEKKVEIVRRLQELSRKIKASRDENEGLQRRARESAGDS